MAIPKVFVSSTCYDLQEERAQLERFITNYGFHPILSEYSGVYYDVDEHTHESCVNEVAHCDMFVLVISGRYGGEFKGGNGESITQAEYHKARELGLPVFTFVKSEVSSAQHCYRENIRVHDHEFAEKINYPAIEKQSESVSIFNFIESVQRASTNNGIENYDSFTDIENHLKKQWAGMFFSFLQKRNEQNKVEVVTRALEKLTGSTSKLESLVGSLHDKEFNKDETQKLISESIISKGCEEFYSLAISEAYLEILFSEEEAQSFISYWEENSTSSIAKIKPKGDMLNYLKLLGFINPLKVDENTPTTSKPFSSEYHIKYPEDDLNKMNIYYKNSLLPSDHEVRHEALIVVIDRMLASFKACTY